MEDIRDKELREKLESVKSVNNRVKGTVNMLEQLLKAEGNDEIREMIMKELEEQKKILAVADEMMNDIENKLKNEIGKLFTVEDTKIN